MRRTFKAKIWARDNFICQYCKQQLFYNTATVDHKIPKQNGGTDDEANLVTACRTCNQTKGKREEIITY